MRIMNSFVHTSSLSKDSFVRIFACFHSGSKPVDWVFIFVSWSIASRDTLNVELAVCTASRLLCMGKDGTVVIVARMTAIESSRVKVHIAFGASKQLDKTADRSKLIVYNLQL